MIHKFEFDMTQEEKVIFDGEELERASELELSYLYGENLIMSYDTEYSLAIALFGFEDSSKGSDADRLAGLMLYNLKQNVIKQEYYD